MEWIAAISTSSLLAMVLWLMRNIIATRLARAVGHEYDVKLENVRAVLRQSEETLKADLKTKESQINALTNGALTGVVNRQAALCQRQILAVEQLWGSVTSLAPAKSVSAQMAIVDFDAALKEAAKDPKVREFFNITGGGFDLSKLQPSEASKARPFVSPLAWALYSAYSAIIFHAALRLKILQSGISKDFTDVEGIKKTVKIALPHQADYIDKYGVSSLHYLLEELESSLLFELSKILKGQDSDKESLEKAASILKEADRLMEQNASMTRQ